MINKRVFYNVAVTFSLLFAILYQSVHSVEHLVEQITTEQCHHELAAGKSQITHDHHHLEHCPVCDFTLSSFLAGAEYSSSAFFASEISTLIVVENTTPDLQSGKILTLRGPPSFIV